MFKIRNLPVERIRPLRHAVLRPGLPPETAVYPGDDDPLALHLGGLLDGELVAVASLFPQLCSLAPVPGGWRLRGVATLESARGHGYGSALIRRCQAYARSRGGALLWCNGRTAVRRFYEQLGFEALGEAFDILVSGEHYVFVLNSPTRRVSVGDRLITANR